MLLDLIGFDYFFLLKKFDPGMPERDFSYTPHFESIEAAHVLEDLQDFLEILPNVDPEADWDRMLAILKEHRGMEVVSRDALRKALQLIRDVQRSGILLLIVRHIMAEPRLEADDPHPPGADRGALPLQAQGGGGDDGPEGGARASSNEKIEELARAVFGSGTVAKLSNYSENSNPEYAQKMLGGFLYVVRPELPARVPRRTTCPRASARSWTC